MNYKIIKCLKFTIDCMKYSVVWQHISAVRVVGAVTCSVHKLVQIKLI